MMNEKKKLSKNAIIGYPAGIITGVTYGLNPLFGKPLMQHGASVESILLFRYLIAVALLGAFLMCRRQSFKVSGRQLGVLLALGVLFTMSSLGLFEAYNYIASGLATTLVFLYPAIVAIIMVALGVVPSWQVWLSLVATFAGVAVMTQGGSGGSTDPVGVLLSVGSAAAYALFIVIINRNKAIASIPNTLLTFYALLTGAVIFFAKAMSAGTGLTHGIESGLDWCCLVGLAVLPTIVSTATLAVATRNIGATKASVMGVFEPITAIVVGTVVFGEALTAPMVLGIVVSVAAITFMVAATKR